MIKDQLTIFCTYNTNLPQFQINIYIMRYIFFSTLQAKKKQHNSATTHYNFDTVIEFFLKR